MIFDPYAFQAAAADFCNLQQVDAYAMTPTLDPASCGQLVPHWMAVAYEMHCLRMMQATMFRYGLIG